ncbi:triose-phosphate isomerase [Deinococcus yavapaiensis]|uniref:Triosephosphate isomerase n=1 Tax=Deinococcus yavapaiensis KR-236 TaxID=694435 RepID=A0A318S3I6_9DEIO|nr:triose-phosphate isomerase [Deinococcus yavapaiensis]PYE53078.1 triosephosphate isomerase [Deinococcus yavapaiensis KR-236]
MSDVTPLLALNWKMNKTPSEARAWATELAGTFTGQGAELAVMAPAIDLPGVAEALRGSRVAYGAQDVSAHASGAYTGEISAAMLLDVGASYAIVGHSERRAYHAETDEKVAAKTRAALQAGLVPIVCVGEELPVREAGEHVAFTLNSLRGSLEGVDVRDARALVIAYEPVWAIGTGKTATADDAEEMASAIRGELRRSLGDVADRVRVLYGGSVKPANIAEICGKANVNGALVGGASLELDSVLGMAGALNV